MYRLVVRLAVTVLVAVAAGLGASGPAAAETCGGAKGVSVVVDFHQLGGGVQTFCDAGGAGETADAQLRDAGYELTYVQRQPGFICRIDDKPAEDPCVNTPPSDAYWSLWWSDGKSGSWSYSSAGASSLKVPQGGYVGMSWQGGGSKAQPGAAPTPHASQPSSSASPHPTPSPHPSTGSSQASSSRAPGPTSSTSDTSTPPQTASHPKHQHIDPSKVGETRGKHAHGRDRSRAGGPLRQVATDAADGTGGSGSGLPGWVAPLAIAVLLGAAGTIALVRRKSNGGA